MTDEVMSSLRRRMIEDMTIRKLGLLHNQVSQLRRSEENTLEGDSQEGIV